MTKIRLTVSVIVEVTSEDYALDFIESVEDDLDAVLSVLDEHEGPTIISAHIVDDEEEIDSTECRFCGEAALAGCCDDCRETFTQDNHS